MTPKFKKFDRITLKTDDSLGVVTGIIKEDGDIYDVKGVRPYFYYQIILDIPVLIGGDKTLYIGRSEDEMEFETTTNLPTFQGVILECRPYGFEAGKEGNDDTENEWIVYNANKPTEWFASSLNKHFAKEMVRRWNKA